MAVRTFACFATLLAAGLVSAAQGPNSRGTPERLLPPRKVARNKSRLAPPYASMPKWA